jgi:hypothetical protein
MTLVNVLVSMKVVMRDEFGRPRLAVIMAVVIDHHREAIVADHSPTEGFGQQLRDQDLVGRPVGEHTPRHQHHTVRSTRLSKMVGRENDDAARLSVLLDDVEDSKLTREVEAGDRLVQQQQIWSRCDRLCDENTLSLTTGQVAERLLSKVRHLEQISGSIDLFSIVATKPPDEAALSIPTHAEHLFAR